MWWGLKWQRVAVIGEWISGGTVLSVIITVLCQYCHQLSPGKIKAAEANVLTPSVSLAILEVLYT